MLNNKGCGIKVIQLIESSMDKIINTKKNYIFNFYLYTYFS